MRAFDFLPPEHPGSAVIFASPHSGRDYPSGFLAESMLDKRSLRSSEDAFVDLLLQTAPQAGAPVLSARIPRAYVDFNRAASELDPALITGVSARGLNPRISSGLGVIPRVVAGGRAIYRGKITLAEARQRLHRYWHPYHDKLTELMDAQRQQFGRAILFDMHSMPRDAVSMSGQHTTLRPDIVLGDRFGAAAQSDLTDTVARIFSDAGLRVARNSPFAGAYITQRYGMPSAGQHAIQIEIDRSLYMDEARIEPRADFAQFQALMANIVTELVQIGAPRSDALPLAAE
ncbi:MAG: N-formylglutamate amidohydrolase [Rhodobacteraceae bacterium]|nr:MAG: N-formylglutamate amidohydrolase [Paracoccaceae bacterium]